MKQQLVKILATQGRFVLAVCVVLLMSAAFAADVNFPNSDSSGDLMSEAAWNGPVPASDRPKIASAGTYTCSTNGTLPGLTFTFTGNKTADMNLAADRRVKMTGHLYLGASKTINFNGGTWDFGGTAGTQAGDYGAVKNVNVVQDACAITNLSNFAPCYNPSGLVSWKLQNQSVLHTVGYFRPDSSGNGAVNVFIESGSIAYAGGALRLGARNDGNRNDVDQSVVVDGAGTSLGFGASDTTSYVGQQLCGARLEVRNGAMAKARGTLIIGKGDSVEGKPPTSNNVVRVEGSGSIMSIGTLFVGGSSNTLANRLEVLDGAQVDISYVTWYGRGNGIICSNGIVNVHQNARSASETNTFVRVQGNRPLVKLSDAGVSQTNYKNGFRFIVDLPEDGYRYDDPDDCPIKSLNSVGCTDETTTFEINGIEAYQERMRRQNVRSERFRIAYIAHNEWNGWLTENKLAELNATLPEGAVLDSPQSSDEDIGRGRSLYLTIKVKLGIVLIVR